MNLLVDRCEEAFAAVLTSPVGALAAVTPSKSYDDKAVPIVICSVTGEAEEDPKGTGNYWLNWSVAIKTRAKQNFDAASPADNPKTTSQALVSIVMAALMVDNLPALLSAVAVDFTVFPAGIFFNSPTSGKDEDGYWIDELSGRAYCCASAIT